MTIKILQGDCREVMRTLAESSVDAIVTDPPYELTSKRPGGRSEATRGAVMGGFMGMQWDGTGVAFDVRTWAEALRVLKPGGYLLAFSGTRTYHRMVCAIEDAGFEVRDQIGWAFGSGFPKSHNGPWGGTALKPAWEPICVARKPLAGTVEANWRQYGTGALNIDACRILVEGEERQPITGAGGLPTRHTVDEPRAPGVVAQPHELGRWPANLIHDGCDEVLAAFPQAAGQQGPISSTAPSAKTSNVYGAMRREGEPSADSDNQGTVGFKMKPGARRLDSGSAARFFYCAKADRADRNAGLDGMPLKPSGMVSNTSGQHMTRRDGKAPPPAANNHPTVKPTDLMRYLCRLVTPAGGTVLDPFLGSGSTLKAAELEGFSGIGIELSPDYIEIARRRIAADAPLFSQAAEVPSPA